MLAFSSGFRCSSSPVAPTLLMLLVAFTLCRPLDSLRLQVAHDEQPCSLSSVSVEQVIS